MKPDRNAWLKGADAKCNVPPEYAARPFRLGLLGAPGVGKGTQAELLSERLAACHLSTGDIFRAAKTLAESERSTAMTQACDCMKRGELVSDDTVLSLLAERAGCLRCHGGFLLDGFPRTIAQAKALTGLLERQNVKLDAVLSYEMPLEKIVARLSGRRTCTGCKAVFHLENRPPRVPGRCDHCGQPLYQREDDRSEVIRVRMQTYEESTAPLEDYYLSLDLLIPIAADGAPEEVFRRTISALELRMWPRLSTEQGYDGHEF
jgi:adenylate kinase